MGGFEAIWHVLRDAVTSPCSHGVGMWIVVLVLGWSGIAKLRRPQRTAGALVDFGVAARLNTSLGIAVGVVELLVAALVAASLPADPVIQVAATALAAALFWCFTVLVARSLRRGATFPCRCFGEDDSPLSAWTLARAAVLAALGTALGVSASLREVDASGQALAISGVAAGAVVMGATLAGLIPRLLRWNRDPFDLTDRRYVRRAEA